MINFNPGCKKVVQALKAQEPQDLKATWHENYMSILGLKHLK